MEIAEFLKLLKKTPRRWYLSREDKAIRFKGREMWSHCPLSKVAGVDPCSVYQAATKLDMPMSTAMDIADAADGGNEKLGPLRRRIKRACGL